MNKVKEYRLEKEISQEQLARIVGVTLKTIQNIEHERATPTVYIAISIAKALEKSVEEIFRVDPKF